MITIESKRLIIRDHIESDLYAMHSWISDEFTMKYLDWKTNSIDQTRKYLTKAIEEVKSSNRRKYFFAAELKNSGQIIGDVGFTIKSKNEFGGIADSGFFFRPQFWGQGYASEALAAIHRFAFDELNLHKVIAGCDSENKASERVMMKCGMIKEAEFKQHHFHRGKWKKGSLCCENDYVVSP
jgi:ribosomal-protein-alanine N-acetyltransferase